MIKNTLTIEQSLESIAIRLDELTGNSMDTSYLKLDLEPMELNGVEDKLDKLNEKVDKLSDAVDGFGRELQTLSTISQTLENMLEFYIQYNQTKNK